MESHTVECTCYWVHLCTPVPATGASEKKKLKIFFDDFWGGVKACTRRIPDSSWDSKLDSSSTGSFSTFQHQTKLKSGVKCETMIGVNLVYFFVMI